MNIDHDSISSFFLIVYIVDDVTCVELPLNNTRHSTATLKVHVPEFLTETKLIQVSPLSIGMSLIETSKPVYRPGDLLKFRIINFDGRMKLYETVLNKLSIYNPSGLKVMEWRDVQIENGMKLFKHPLANYNIEGLWKIIAITYDNQVIEKQFQVDARGKLTNCFFRGNISKSNRFAD